MLTSLLARARFLAVMLPTHLVRTVRKSSPFGEKAHRAVTAWDR